MPNMTLAIPEDLKAKMDKRPEINWSEVARQAIHNKMMLLDKMDQLLSKSQLTAADIEQAAYEVNTRIYKKHLKKKEK